MVTESQTRAVRSPALMTAVRGCWSPCAWCRRRRPLGKVQLQQTLLVFVAICESSGGGGWGSTALTHGNSLLPGFPRCCISVFTSSELCFVSKSCRMDHRISFSGNMFSLRHLCGDNGAQYTRHLMVVKNLLLHNLIL